MRFKETEEFKKEFKKLSKKYKSLIDDLADFKKILTRFPQINSRHSTVLKIINNIKIIKARLFCRYLKGSSLRIIYALIEKEITIIFIELYFKGIKEREDGKRIDNFLKSIC